MKIAIVHPWLPQYRVKFFQALDTELKKHGIEVDVYYGETPPEWTARNDSSDFAVGEQLPTRFITLGNRSVALKSITAIKRNGPYDLIVLEQAIRNFETYALLARQKKYARKIAFWGHGRVFTKSKTSIEMAVYRIMTNRADWFFSYTEAGAAAVSGAGFDPRKVTTVYNSIDTAQLKRDLLSVTPDDIDRFRQKYDLTTKSTLYIGGIDRSKRIEFLLAAAQACHEADPDFRLLCIGSGQDESMVLRAAAEQPWLSHLPATFGHEKAIAFRAAALLAIPGRVGLVAVDSLTAGLPIVTTNWPFHAPEFEYISSPDLARVSRDEVDAYAKSISELLNNTDEIRRLSTNLLQESSKFSIQSMAANFAHGVIKVIQDA